MNRKEIKSMRREIALRPLYNLIKNYWYEAGRTIIGGVLFAGTMLGASLVAGIIG